MAADYLVERASKNAPQGHFVRETSAYGGPRPFSPMPPLVPIAPVPGPVPRLDPPVRNLNQTPV